MGGRFLSIAIASAPRVKRMAAVIVRRLCRQRRSQLRKQLRHSPPLYQSTRPPRQVKSMHCVVKRLHFIRLNPPDWGHHRTNITVKGSFTHGLFHCGSEIRSFREVSPIVANRHHMSASTDHTLSQKLLLSCTSTSAASESEGRGALLWSTGACETRGV